MLTTRSTSTSAPSPHAAGDLRAIREIEQFLLNTYAYQAGWMELSTIYGDPADRRVDPATKRRLGYDWRQGWRNFSPETAFSIAREIYQLGLRLGNVYISRGLYERPHRNAPRLPSRRIFIDDAPRSPELAYSAAVESSPGNFQGWYEVAELAPAAELAELARRAGVALGGDRSGFDEQQLVRPPHTYNTKGLPKGTDPKQGHLVRLAVECGPTYTRRQLERTWPAIAELDTTAPPAPLESDMALARARGLLVQYVAELGPMIDGYNDLG